MTEKTMELPLFDPAGEQAGSIAVPAIFAASPNNHAVYLATVRQYANRRAGTSSTQTRGEVSGGGRKPWKQKHTGRARQGSIRAPQWPGGGIAFGPKPRGYAMDLPARTRRQAMRSALAGKMRAGQVAILQELKLASSKTRDAVALLRKVGAAESGLLVVSSGSEEIRRAFRNLPGCRMEPASAVSVGDVLKFHRVVIVRDALEALEKRCAP
jgi:large subunit ribosomal protein L4